MDPKYRLGFPELDEQHEAIDSALLALIETVDNKDRRHLLHYVLEDLIGKMTAHFSLEEAIMRVFSYPLTEEHTRAHRELLGAIKRYRSVAQGGPETEKPPFGLFYDQILGHDTHLATYLREVKNRAGIA